MYTLTVEYTGDALTATLLSTGAAITIELDAIEVYSELVASFEDVAALVSSIEAAGDFTVSVDGGAGAVPQSVTVGSFDLITSAAQLAITPLSVLSTSALITWSQAQLYLGASDDDRLYVEGLINAVSEAAERYYAMRPLRQRHWVKIVDGTGYQSMLLDTYPVASSEVRIDSAREFGESTITDHLLYAERGEILIEGGRFPAGRQNIRLDYVAGYDPVPLDLVTACAESVAYQRGRLQQNGAGIRSMSAPNGIQTTYELTFPMNAQRVFESYRDWRP